MNNLPYPRLQKNRSDYVTAQIDADLTWSDLDAYLIIRGTFQLIDGELKKLIQEGTASYCLIVKCRATGRIDVFTDDNGVTEKFMLKLVKADYTDKIEVIPGIVAKEDITNYTNDNLSKDYQESYIILPKHALIAQCETFELTLYRNSDDSSESICRFSIGRLYNFSITGDYIEITLPKEIIDSLSVLRSKESAQIFTSMFVVPVIQQVVQTYWVDKEDAPETKWYDSLKDRIEEIILPGKNFSAFEITTTILEGLMFDSARFLAKHYGDNDDSE